MHIDIVISMYKTYNNIYAKTYKIFKQLKCKVFFFRSDSVPRFKCMFCKICSFFKIYVKMAPIPYIHVHFELRNTRNTNKKQKIIIFV